MSKKNLTGGQPPESISDGDNKSNKAKSYQVKQIRNLIVKYRLGDSDVD